MLALNDVRIGIIGLGYVGLPLALEFGRMYPTVGFDIKEGRIAELKAGRDSTREAEPAELAAAKRLTYTSDEKALKGSKVQLLGVSYKADIDDTRESPALKLIELLQDEGADVSYHDPYVTELPEHGLSSTPLDPSGVDCLVIVTAHSGIDYEELVEKAPLVVDLRNATGANGTANGKVWKL